jgi:hypothetical protein
LEGVNMTDNKHDKRRSSQDDKRTFEPKPRKIDIEKLGPWLIERDRKVLAMLEEYDRRQEKRRRQQ